MGCAKCLNGVCGKASDDEAEPHANASSTRQIRPVPSRHLPAMYGLSSGRSAVCEGKEGPACMRFTMNGLAAYGRQGETKGNQRRGVLRIQTTMQAAGSTVKIVARLRQMFFGRVTVLRNHRRRSFRLNDFDWVMMGGDDKQRVHHQPKQQLRYDSQPRRV